MLGCAALAAPAIVAAPLLLLDTVTESSPAPIAPSVDNVARRPVATGAVSFSGLVGMARPSMNWNARGGWANGSSPEAPTSRRSDLDIPPENGVEEAAPELAEIEPEAGPPPGRMAMLQAGGQTGAGAVNRGGGSSSPGSAGFGGAGSAGTGGFGFGGGSTAGVPASAPGGEPSGPHQSASAGSGGTPPARTTGNSPTPQGQPHAPGGAPQAQFDPPAPPPSSPPPQPTGPSGASPIVLGPSDGPVTGTPTFPGPVVCAGCTIAPGNSPGTVEIDGDFVFDDEAIQDLNGPDATAGLLIIEVFGLDEGEYDKLVVNGTADFLGGMIQFVLGPALSLEDDFTLAFVEAREIGTFENVQLAFLDSAFSPLSPEIGEFSVFEGACEWNEAPGECLFLSFSSFFEPASNPLPGQDQQNRVAAPEPESLLLLGLGLLGLAAARRRR